MESLIKRPVAFNYKCSRDPVVDIANAPAAHFPWSIAGVVTFDQSTDTGKLVVGIWGPLQLLLTYDKSVEENCIKYNFFHSLKVRSENWLRPSRWATKPF